MRFICKHQHSAPPQASLQLSEDLFILLTSQEVWGEEECEIPPQEFISHFSWTVRNQSEPHCIVPRFFPFFFSPPGFTCLEPITWKIRPFHWKAKPGPVDIFTMNWWPARWNTYLNCLGAVCEVSLSKCLHTRLHIFPPFHHPLKKKKKNLPGD